MGYLLDGDNHKLITLFDLYQAKDSKDNIFYPVWIDLPVWTCDIQIKVPIP